FGRHLPEGIRHDLEALRRAAELKAAHLAELRHEAVGVAREQRPGRDLVQPADLANHREADRAAASAVEPELREGNAELGTPSLRVPRHLHVPHRIPAVIARAIVKVVAIALDAGGVDAK